MVFKGNSTAIDLVFRHLIVVVVVVIVIIADFILYSVSIYRFVTTVAVGGWRLRRSLCCID